MERCAALAHLGRRDVDVKDAKAHPVEQGEDHDHEEPEELAGVRLKPCTPARGLSLSGSNCALAGRCQATWHPSCDTNVTKLAAPTLAEPPNTDIILPAGTNRKEGDFPSPTNHPVDE